MSAEVKFDQQARAMLAAIPAGGGGDQRSPSQRAAAMGLEGGPPTAGGAGVASLGAGRVTDVATGGTPSASVAGISFGVGLSGRVGAGSEAPAGGGGDQRSPSQRAAAMGLGGGPPTAGGAGASSLAATRVTDEATGGTLSASAAGMSLGSEQASADAISRRQKGKPIEALNLAEAIKGYQQAVGSDAAVAYEKRILELYPKALKAAHLAGVSVEEAEINARAARCGGVIDFGIRVVRAREPVDLSDFSAEAGGTVQTAIRLMSALDLRYDTGRTRLFDAIDTGRPDLLQLLLELGWDPNVISRNFFGIPRVSVLIYALSWKQPAGVRYPTTRTEVVRLLIQAGADVNWVCQPGQVDQISFVWLAMNRSIELFRMALEAGADTELRHKGETLLLCLMRERESRETFAQLELLLEFGADLTARNCEGRSAFWIAKKMGHLGVLQRLLDYARIHAPRAFAMGVKEIEAIEAAKELKDLYDWSRFLHDTPHRLAGRDERLRHHRDWEVWHLENRPTMAHLEMLERLRAETGAVQRKYPGLGIMEMIDRLSLDEIKALRACSCWDEYYRRSRGSREGAEAKAESTEAKAEAQGAGAARVGAGVTVALT